MIGKRAAAMPSPSKGREASPRASKGSSMMVSLSLSTFCPSFPAQKLRPCWSALPVAGCKSRPMSMLATRGSTIIVPLSVGPFFAPRRVLAMRMALSPMLAALGRSPMKRVQA